MKADWLADGTKEPGECLHGVCTADSLPEGELHCHLE